MKLELDASNFSNCGSYYLQVAVQPKWHEVEVNGLLGFKIKSFDSVLFVEYLVAEYLMVGSLCSDSPSEVKVMVMENELQ